MTIKYLAGNRVQGTRAERFPSLLSTGISLTGCQGYYPFNEFNDCNNYATTANGFPNGLGSAINGTRVIGTGANAGRIEQIEGISGNGALFFSNAVFDLDDDIVSGTSDFSIACWIKPITNTSSYRSLVSNYATSGSFPNGFEFHTVNNSNNTPRFYLQGGSNVNGSESLATNAWSHVACTRESGTVKIWSKGELDASGTKNESIAGGNMRIGGISPTSEWWGGGICEVSIWSRALTAAEIGKLGGISLKDKIIFDETDTGKSYIWNATSRNWTEIT